MLLLDLINVSVLLPDFIHIIKRPTKLFQFILAYIEGYPLEIYEKIEKQKVVEEQYKRQLVRKSAVFKDLKIEDRECPLCIIYYEADDIVV